MLGHIRVPSLVIHFCGVHSAPSPEHLGAPSQHIAGLVESRCGEIISSAHVSGRATSDESDSTYAQ